MKGADMKRKTVVIAGCMSLFLVAVAVASNITAQATIRVQKGDYNRSYTLTQDSQTLTSELAVSGPQTITTNPTALNLGGTSTKGIAWFRNLDASNYVEVGTGTGVSFVAFLKLEAGQACYVWLATNAPYAKADTASVLLDYWIQSR